MSTVFYFWVKPWVDAHGFQFLTSLHEYRKGQKTVCFLTFIQYSLTIHCLEYQFNAPRQYLYFYRAFTSPPLDFLMFFTFGLPE